MLCKCCCQLNCFVCQLSLAQTFHLVTGHRSSLVKSITRLSFSTYVRIGSGWEKCFFYDYILQTGIIRLTLFKPWDQYTWEDSKAKITFYHTLRIWRICLCSLLQVLFKSPMYCMNKVIFLCIVNVNEHPNLDTCVPLQNGLANCTALQIVTAKHFMSSAFWDLPRYIPFSSTCCRRLPIKCLPTVTAL